MQARRPLALVLTLLGTIFWIVPPAAYADRIGRPYRGPIELLGGGTGQGQDTDEGTGMGDEGGGEEGGGGEGGGGEGGGGEGGGGEGGGGESGESGLGGGTGGGTGGGPSGGAQAKLDGTILWQWWWEHNKDRYLARSAERGAVNAGSIQYWFGHGAKYPPRNIVPVSEKLRRTRALKYLRNGLHDRSTAVKAESCIAVGRLGFVPPSPKQRKNEAKQKDANLPANLIVRELTAVLEREKDKEVRTSAILGLGICGDPKGCEYLTRNYDAKLSVTERAYANIAFGLARYKPALKILADQLPKSAQARGITDQMIAAVTAVGLMGPAALEGEDALSEEHVEQLRKLANPKGNDALVMQVATALSRLQVDRKTVARLATTKTSRNIKWTAILALSNYFGDEKEAEGAFKTLQTRKCFGSGDGQDKSFSVLAMGELASHLDPNSKLYDRILDFIKDEALNKKNNYTRSCAAIALGVANDTRAIPEIAALLTDTTVQDHVVAAACVGLGLLRADNQVDLMIANVLRSKKWNADARGYAALGIALAGDTTRTKRLVSFARTPSLNDKTLRQVPLAIGVIGDRGDVALMVRYFAKQWKKNRRYEVSNAAYGLGWIKDESALKTLRKMITKGGDPQLRGMAAIAMGYAGAFERVDPLTRCYANVSFRNRFGHWEMLRAISRIL
ncbi:MAG: HEAT repeat domain-containing protein [Planctomycetota bacterium]|jgi:HEAT repeat protein